MNELFLKIVNMSIAASWLVLAVMVLRLIPKKAPRWINVLLWGIVAVKLVFPLSIKSAFSLIPSAETIPLNIEMDATPAIDSGISAVNDVINPVFSTSFAPAPLSSANPLQIWIPLAALLWICGMAAMLLYTAISYWRLRRRVDTAVLYKDNIYQSEFVDSPFVLGMIRPKIYLPFRMEPQAMAHVIAHECAHIRRKDHWWKPLGFLLLTIHWFNPMMWIAYVLLCRDMELACDETVIKGLGSEQRADYTQALVACSVSRRSIAACPLAFGEVGVKARVKSVMNYKKPAFWVIVLAFIACAVVAVCFLTDPVGFRFDEASHTIVFANHFDMRTVDDAAAVEMNSSQISELSSRLAGLKNTRHSEAYAGLTPCYQISARLQDGSYIRISGYSLSENNRVGIEWNGERYVVSDSEFQDYLSRICAEGDVSGSENTATGSTFVYEGEGFGGSFTITLFNDGTFSYYEGMLSSYIGIGTWTQNADTITLTEDKQVCYGRTYQFRLDDGDLVWLGQNPHNFIYVKVRDGERFCYAGEVFHASDIPDTDPPQATLEEHWDLIPMVMVNGTLYLDTGMESQKAERTDHFDGEITSTVEGWQEPTQNDQSNFGAGYGYQYGETDRTIELCIEGRWWIYATEEMRQGLQFPDSEVPGAVTHIVDIIDRAEEEGLPCDEAEELFYEDETAEYYFSVIKSHYVMVLYSDSSTEDIVTALNAGRVSIQALDDFGVTYHTVPKN